MDNNNHKIDLFLCKRCGYQTNFKNNLVKHLKKNVECNAILKDIPRETLLNEIPYKKYENKIFKCDFCDSSFTASSNKSRHMKTCKRRPQDEIEGLKELCHNLQTQLNEMKCSSTTINNNQHINVYTSNNLRNFGSENMDALPNTLIRDLFMDLKFKDLLENLHCDPDYPENHNIRIKSIKRNAMEVFRNDKWDIVSFVNGLNELLLQGHRIFKQFYRKNKEVVRGDMTEEELEEILNKLDDIENLNKQAVKPLYEELQFMLEAFRSSKELVKVD